MPVSIRRQANGGDSALVHSIYMQIQVPFFTTFRHYHPDDKLLFFSNLDQFPDYLERLFKELRIETVTLLISASSQRMVRGMEKSILPV